MSNLVGEPYQALYKNYYADGQVAEKRLLSARDALCHIKTFTGEEHFRRVVDVGAGEGSLLQLLDASSMADQLYALEISESGQHAVLDRRLASLVECKSFDGYTIPYPDQFFDLAISIHVMEHVEHERLMLRELRRVARRIVIEVPLEDGLRVERSIAISGPYGHINFYSPPTFLNLLRTTGFRVLGSRVFTSSLAYEQYCAGRVRGFLKHLIRSKALAASDRVAPLLMTYVMAAYCEAV
jgi:ubiquinone/menaquinone biosynthesis C-methylase UbiE